MAKKSKSAPSKPRPKTAQLSKEVQARLSAFVNSSTEGFALLDGNLNYMFINPAAERMIGVSREAVVGKNILDIVPDVKESGRYDKYLKVLKTGKPFHIEYMVSRTKFRDIHAGLKAFRVENWLGLVFTDISERKNAEEILRQSEQNYRVLFEGTLDGLFVVSAETGRIVLANRSVAKMFSFDSPEAMIGVYPINFVTPQNRNEVLRFVAEDVLRDLSEEWSRSNHGAHEIRALANDGRKIWLEIQGTPTEYQGKLAYLVSNKDITERKNAEEALKESEEKYRALIEAIGRAGEGIIIIQDREEREAAFVFVNDEFCRMSGYSREELLNRSAWDLVPYEIAVRLKDWYKLRHMGEATPGHYEAAGVCKDGTIVPLDLSVVTMPWQGKIATVLYMRDITERKRMEEALRRSEQTIRQLAKASVYAHEEERQRVSLEVHDRISQTLTAAFHQLQALEAIPIENTGAQEILKRASALLQESIRESRNIIEDLYSPVMSDFGIVAVIDEELRRFEEETGCRTKFDKRCTGRPTPDVELTTYRIFHEVLANIKRHAIGASKVEVYLSCEAGVVSLQVKDNGPGFDVEAALQNGRMGGLKGMQRRAELGGGTCEVISSRGQGTTVTVRLPYSSETQADEGEGGNTT